MNSEVPTTRRPVALWLTMMGIGLILYSVFAFIPGIVGAVLGLLAPGIVAAIVWAVWDRVTDLEDAGIVAGLLAGVGAMPVRVVLPPSIEWFSLVDIVPDQYATLVGMVPIPFAYGIVGYFTGKIIRRIRRRKAARESAPAS